MTKNLSALEAIALPRNPYRSRPHPIHFPFRLPRRRTRTIQEVELLWVASLERRRRIWRAAVDLGLTIPQDDWMSYKGTSYDETTNSYSSYIRKFYRAQSQSTLWSWDYVEAEEMRYPEVAYRYDCLTAQSRAAEGLAFNLRQRLAEMVRKQLYPEGTYHDSYLQGQGYFDDEIPVEINGRLYVLNCKVLDLSGPHQVRSL